MGVPASSLSTLGYSQGLLVMPLVANNNLTLRTTIVNACGHYALYSASTGLCTPCGSYRGTQTSQSLSGCISCKDLLTYGTPFEQMLSYQICTDPENYEDDSGIPSDPYPGASYPSPTVSDIRLIILGTIIPGSVTICAIVSVTVFLCTRKKPIQEEPPERT